MVDLRGHEAGNGGYSQRKPTAHRVSSTRKLVIWPVLVSYSVGIRSVNRLIALLVVGVRRFAGAVQGSED